MPKMLRRHSGLLHKLFYILENEIFACFRNLPLKIIDNIYFKTRFNKGQILWTDTGIK